MSNAQSNNPLDMLQGMWNQMGFQLPGMVTPTLDEGELEKQIGDLRSVENWLRMNLSMLQMTIQNLEMQKSALGTFRSMSAHFTKPTNEDESAPAAPENPFFRRPTMTATPESTASATESPPDEAALTKAAMWPWEMMNELNATMQAQLAKAGEKNTAPRKDATQQAVAKSRTAAKKPAAKRTVRK